MRNKNTISTFLLFSLLLIIGGCSSSSSSGSTEKEKSESQTTSKDTLSKIKNEGKIIIGTGGNYRPFNYMDKNNNLVGYDIEWGKIIAKGLGVKPEFVTGQFAGLIPGLQEGKFDILFAGVNITDERKKTLDFSEPYAKDGIVAVVNKGSHKVKNIKDIKGKVIGVIAGATSEAVVRQIGGYQQLKQYPGGAEVFQDLANGRIDAIAIGQDAAGDYIKNAAIGKNMEIAGKPYQVVDVGVPMKKNSPELKAAIDKIIQEKKQDGTYDKLTQKYFGLTFN